MKHRSVVRIVFKIFIIVMILASIWGLAEYTRRGYLQAYNESVSLFEAGKYDEAVRCLEQMGDYQNYRDVPELLEKYGIETCPHCGKVLE